VLKYCNSSPTSSETGHIKAAQTSIDINIITTLLKRVSEVQVKILKDFIKN
jgi:hypothetical protein